jgi:hypothetical protein
MVPPEFSGRSKYKQITARLRGIWERNSWRELRWCGLKRVSKKKNNRCGGGCGGRSVGNVEVNIFLNGVHD